MAGGLGGLVFMGWDMTSALNLGAALHIDPAVIAEILPAVERVVVRTLKEGG